MSFDEDKHNGDGENKKTTFFGMEVSDKVTYIIIAVLVLIFIRQASVLMQALG